MKIQTSPSTVIVKALPLKLQAMYSLASTTPAPKQPTPWKR
jgi:hypothetical protein